MGVLAKHPTRALPTAMPQHVIDSGRCLLTTTLLGDVWISGAVLYGEPNAHHYPCYMRNNEHLLHHLATQVCHLSVGPRFLSGDWNVHQDSLPSFQILIQAGFRDIQDVALERWGKAVMPTCKNKTRKDFLYISPELQDLLFGVEVLDDVWPDHAVLLGRFHALKNAPEVWVWPSPYPMQWPNQFATDLHWQPASGDMTSEYHRVWNELEQSALQKMPRPVDKRMLGRGARTQPKRSKSGLFSPVKVGRKGDFQPGFFGPSMRHSQWIRQARRIQAYARLANSAQPSLAIQKAESWGAVLRATGFEVSFADWWLNCAFKTNDAPEVCPMFPPDAEVASAMFDSFSIAVRDLELQLRNQSKQYACFRRDQNPNLVFSDIRSPQIPGVDVLLQPARANIEAVDEEVGQITLDQPCPFLPEVPIVCKGQRLQVIHHEGDALWVENPEVLSVGDVVSQTKFVGNHADLEEAFLAVWRERWMRHADVPAERWSKIVAFIKQYIPPAQHNWPSLQPEVLASLIKGKKRTTSHGLDGVTLADLKGMPHHVLQVFCDMYAESEATGSWPDQLLQGKVVSLAKVVTPGSPTDFRPITVFSLLYRLWSSYQAKRALMVLDAGLPETLFGNRPGRYAGQVWAKLLWCIERSFHQNIGLTGLVADLQKAFNKLAGHLGLPCNMLLAWAGALTQMRRRFLLRGSLTEGIPSVTGFPEGCGLSCVAMLLIDMAFHHWQAAFFPLCTPLSYVDDWQLICPDCSLLPGAKAC